MEPIWNLKIVIFLNNDRFLFGLVSPRAVIMSRVWWVAGLPQPGTVGCTHARASYMCSLPVPGCVQRGVERGAGPCSCTLSTRVSVMLIVRGRETYVARGHFRYRLPITRAFSTPVGSFPLGGFPARGMQADTPFGRAPGWACYQVAQRWPESSLWG